MAFKFLAFFALVAAAQAGVIQQAYSAPAYYSHGHPYGNDALHATPTVYAEPTYTKTIVAQPTLVKAYAPAYAKADEYDPNPQYAFSYDVHDSLTGDAKSQHETRHGDVVEGSYSLIEADGTKRIVDYTADPHHGFNAVVRKEGTPIVQKAVVATPVVQKTLIAQPVVQKTLIAQPVVQKTLISQPVVQKTIVSQPAVYAQPAYVKSYAQPAVYAHAQPAVYAHAQPAVYAQPAYTKTVVAQPALVKSYAAAPALAYNAYDNYHH
ncbi:cuticle protein 19-like [Culicoides brevitarsis]|uniref:cuticle protein 19-like n=1 Tax=Culicoides brevitarsis TaxID=469753 RepID=UPI00307B3885